LVEGLGLKPNPEHLILNPLDLLDRLLQSSFELLLNFFPFIGIPFNIISFTRRGTFVSDEFILPCAWIIIFETLFDRLQNEGASLSTKRSFDRKLLCLFVKGEAICILTARKLCVNQQLKFAQVTRVHLKFINSDFFNRFWLHLRFAHAVLRIGGHLVLCAERINTNRIITDY